MFKSAQVKATVGLNISFVDETSDLVRVSAAKGYVLPDKLDITSRFKLSNGFTAMRFAEAERVEGKEGEEAYFLFHFRGGMDDEDKEYLDANEVTIEVTVEGGKGEIQEIKMELPEPEVIPEEEEEKAVIIKEEKERITAAGGNEEELQTLILDVANEKIDRTFREKYKTSVHLVINGDQAEGNVVQAKPGDFAEIHIDNIEGYEPRMVYIFLKEKKENGDPKFLMYHFDAPKEYDWDGIMKAEVVEEYQNYMFIVPDEPIKNIIVTYAQVEPEQEEEVSEASED